MILTVTLNAALDKTYRIEGFAVDRVHRPSDLRTVAGGKGINVARVFLRLGGHATATGFLGGHNGRLIRRALHAEGIPAQFVWTREESRTCIAAVDPVAGTQTEINEPGPAVSGRELKRLASRIRALLRKGDYHVLCLSGSTPPGVPESFYPNVIGDARTLGVRTVVDASGAHLRAAVAAKPWMIKPNVYELSTLAGRALAEDGEIGAAALALRAGGIEIVAATLGRRGAVCAVDEGLVAVKPPSVPFVNSVGSGDAFVAASLWALQQGRSVVDSMRYGVAAGTANTMVHGAGFIEPRCIDDVMARVSVGPVVGGGLPVV